MFANGGTADEQFGRHRHRPRQQQQQGSSNAWSSPLPNSDDFDFEDELRHFANLERGYANRNNNSSSSNRNHHKHKRRAGFGGAAAEEDAINGGEPQPLRTVKFDTMVRRQNTEQIRHALKRRKRSLMATEALADGGDAAHALVAAAEDDSSALTEDEAHGAGDLIEVQGELAAARVYEDAMLFSTCSEDEEVLLKTLEMMRAQSCMMASCPDLDEKKKNNHLFEEDDEEAEEKPKKKKKSNNDADYIPPEYHESVPDNTAGIFDDTHTQHSAGGTAASSKHEAAGSSDEDEDDDLDNLLFTEGGAPHVREHEDSRRQRVHRLRLQVHEERKRRGNPPAECFLCMWGNSQYDAVNAPPMHALKQLLETEIGRRDLRAVARTAHKYFKEEIWKKMVHAGKKIPMWRTRDIYLHLLHHEREPNIFVYRYTGMLDKLAQTLINQVHVYDPNTRRIMVDRVALNGFNNTVKLLQSFYNSNPRKMTFFDDKASFDLAAAASGQRHTGGGSGSGVPNLSSIGHYELKAIEAPHAVNVRNK